MSGAPVHPKPSPDAAQWVRRPLGGVERWYWITDQLSPLNVISRVRVWGRVPDATWRAALDALQARHPLLRVAIAADENGADPWFVPVTDRPIPLRRVTASEAVAGGAGGTDAGVPADDEVCWQRELNERELVEPVDWGAGPLARALVVTGRAAPAVDAVPVPFHDLVLTLPHCVADGTTVLSLLRAWTELAAAQSDVTATPFDGAGFGGGGAGNGSGTTNGGTGTGARRALPPLLDLLPAPHRGEDGVNRSGRQREADERLMERLRPQRVEPTVAVPFGERRTRLLHRSLDSVALDALVAACRRERTTVHGALAAAMTAAVAHDAGALPPSSVAIGSPVSFRDELEPPVGADEVGTFVATVPTVAELRTGTDLWSVARSVAADLARRKEAGEHFCAVHTFGQLCPATVAESEPLVNFMDEKGPINLCLSNIGRFDFPSAIGPWRVSGAQFVAGLSVNGQLVATANTSHGRLQWNFTYVDAAMPRARAEHLVDTCVSILLSAIGLNPA